jgi:hypothetical protein
MSPEFLSVNLDSIERNKTLLRAVRPQVHQSHYVLKALKSIIYYINSDQKNQRRNTCEVNEN